MSDSYGRDGVNAARGEGQRRGDWPPRFPSRAEREALARSRAENPGGGRASARYEFGDLDEPGWYEVEVCWAEAKETSKGKPAWKLALGAVGTGRKRDWTCPLGWAERVEQLLSALLPELAETGGAADEDALLRLRGRRCGALWDRQGGEGAYADRYGWQALAPLGELRRLRERWGDQASRQDDGPDERGEPAQAVDDDLPF